MPESACTRVLGIQKDGHTKASKLNPMWQALALDGQQAVRDQAAA